MDVKCSVYIATSVDGFIAKDDGDIQWLQRPEYALAGEGGISFHEFCATVDAFVMGRHTFEKVLTFGDWPYGDTPVIVLSSGKVDVPDSLRSKVRVESGTPEELVSRLASEGKRHLGIDGA